MTQPSHWELGHILSLGGRAGGRWHIRRENTSNTALCGVFGYRSDGELPAALGAEERIRLAGAPECLTCQHIRRGK